MSYYLWPYPFEGEACYLELDSGPLPEDHPIRRAWRLFKWYEQDLLEFVAIHAPRGGLYIDVGANIGNHSVYFTRLAQHVLAFDPDPTCWDAWGRNVTRNGRQGRATLITRALGATGADSIDSHVGRNDGPVSFVKIDTDGQDLDVLLGAAVAVQRWRPHIGIETCTPDLEAAVREQLAKWDYTVLREFKTGTMFLYAMHESGQGDVV